MFGRSSWLALVPFLAALITSNPGGLVMSSHSSPRELSGPEKRALRGGQTQYRNACCAPIADCQTLPSYKTCAQYNGTLRCARGLAYTYSFNNNDLSCRGPDPGNACNLGAEAPCILTMQCEVDDNGDCIGSGNDEPFTPGYASCTDDCGT